MFPNRLQTLNTLVSQGRPIGTSHISSHENPIFVLDSNHRGSSHIRVQCSLCRTHDLSNEQSRGTRLGCENYEIGMVR
uniref:Uncharacterized protein n=1 Tax=Lotus japonicus TaxID=34305 RepID=I3SHX8_LOTJA|nr:unknown [Lotus japonicus]